MSVAKKAPSLRFKGFDGEWEEKRLDAIVAFSKGKGYSKSDITEEGCPLFLYGQMYTNYQIEVSSVQTFCKLRDGSVLSKGGEVVCPASGETAEDIACASAVVEKGIVLGGDLNILTPRKDADLDSVFLALSLTYGTPRNVIKSRAQGKTVVHIHNLDFADIGVFNPSLPEQQKLREVFRSLDSLIASRETALEKLKSLKKAMLEKMFPRAGAKVPEVRFKGFEGEWEKKRLGEVLKIGNGKDYKHLATGNVPVYGTGGYMTSVAEALAQGPSVCIGRKGTIDSPQYLEGAFWTVDTLFYTYGYNKISAYWLYCQFQRIPWLNYNEASGVPSLSKRIIEDIIISVPSLLEQRKIGAYFRSLDALISARRDEIAKLKDLKKALLERMFV